MNLIMPGYPGFQARAFQMARRLGGDWIAHRAAQQSFHDGMTHVQRNAMSDRPWDQGWNHGAGWVVASDDQFAAAAQFGENPFRNAAVPDPLGIRREAGFSVRWDGKRLSRFSVSDMVDFPDEPSVGITLASATEERAGTVSIHISDTAQVMARAAGRGFSVTSRNCKVAGVTTVLVSIADHLGFRSDG